MQKNPRLRPALLKFVLRLISAFRTGQGRFSITKRCCFGLRKLINTKCLTRTHVKLRKTYLSSNSYRMRVSVHRSEEIFSVFTLLVANIHERLLRRCASLARTFALKSLIKILGKASERHLINYAFWTAFHE